MRASMSGGLRDFEVKMKRFIGIMIALGYQVIQFRDEQEMKTCWRFKK